MIDGRITDTTALPVALTAPDSAVSTFLEVMNGLKEYVLWLEERQDSRFVCLFANRSFLERLGYAGADIVGKDLAELLSVDDCRKLNNAIHQVKSSVRPELYLQNVISLSFQNCGENKSKLSCYVLRSKVRGTSSVFLFCTEIDQRYATAMRNSQLYEEALDGIFTLDCSGRIRNGNRKIEQLVGHRKGQLTIDHFSRFMPEKKAEGFIKFLRHRLKDEIQNYPYVIDVQTPDGEGKHYAVRTIKSPVTESEIVVNIRDVSDAKRLENLMKESEAKYRAVVDQSRDVIFLLNRNGVFLANEVAYRLLGDQIRKEDADWKDYSEKVVPEDRDRVVTFLADAFRNLVEGSGTDNLSTEFRLTAKDGVALNMALTVSAITILGEKALLGSVRDVTETKRLEAKTRESMRLGTLAQFAASVAHEIRNPLEALTSAGLLLSRSLNLDGESKQLLDVIIDATDNINNVVNEFVSLTSEPEYQFSKTDIKALLTSVIKTVKRFKSYHPRVSITASYQRGLTRIQCDVGQLHKALVNVINNSCSAIAGEGTIEIRAEKAMMNSEKALRLKIRDSGKGIPPEIMSHIWEPFVTSKKKGMGLGLFIARHCLEDHGGRIDIPFSDETGTTVEILLPVFGRRGTRHG